VTTVLGDEVSIESGELTLISPTDVRVTYDSTTGELTLYVDGVEVATDAVDEAAERANAGAYWYTALPPASWITNIAAWSSVLAPTPPAPTTVLYNAMLAAGPLAMWDFSEAATPVEDVTVGSDDVTTVSGVTFQNWTAPDGVDRATASTGKATVPTPASADLGLASGGVTYVAAYGSGFATGTPFLAECEGSPGGSGTWAIQTDATHVYVRYGRTGSTGAYRLWRAAVNSTVRGAAGLLTLHIPQTGSTAPILRINGVGYTMSSFAGPTGTQDTAVRRFFPFGGISNTITAEIGPIAVYAGNPDLSAVEAAAVTEGWY
jgi:hypothetical protein